MNGCGCACHSQTLGLSVSHLAPCCYPQMAVETGYEGVTHAGIAVVAADTGRVLLAQRAYDETDDESVRETWEFPGGSLNPGEDPLTGASREFSEEIGTVLPPGEVTNGWRGGDNPETGHYQGFVYTTPHEMDPVGWVPTTEVQAIAWFDSSEVEAQESSGTMRPEIVATMDWSLVFPETFKESSMTEPTYDDALFALTPIPVHGVIAPEDVATGDGRGFNSGSMTRRPMRLPFSDQHVSIGGHDGSVVTGSVDRMMRKDGLIHWEGSLMPSEETERLVARMEFFGGRYGVSVDGDAGSVDTEKSKAAGIVWFDAVRASGLTACAIPAFHQAYVAFGHHPDMPAEDETLTASMFESGDIVGARQTFGRGPGWVTNPEETRTLHDYWTKKGEEGYAKVGWGTDGDFTRAKALIGAKIAANSPDKMRFLNQIIAQWHFDALGYWPGDLGKPGNPPDTAENRARAAQHAKAALDMDKVTNVGIAVSDDKASAWEAVLVSSAAGKRKRAPLDYFHQHPSMVEDVWALESGALIIEEPDEFGFQRAWGFAAEWGVCHIGMNGVCVEPPRTGSDDYPEFHLGYTRTDEGMVYTGVLTYGVGHRDSDTILSETPEQAFFDNINNAWASVRVGENERGIWFSGVVLPGVPEDHIVKIEASGQVSGEWLYNAMRACLTVNVPGFPNERPSATYDAQGNVIALAASAFHNIDNPPCAEETPAEKMAALAAVDAEIRFDEMRAQWAAKMGA